MPQALRVMREDALEYIDKVKKRLQPEEYNTFMSLLKETMTDSTDIGFKVAKASELFKGNRDLVAGFNCFVPKGYEITDTTYDGRCYDWISAVKDSVDFLNKIRRTMNEADDRTYKAFLLDIMSKYERSTATLIGSTGMVQHFSRNSLFCSWSSLGSLHSAPRIG